MHHAFKLGDAEHDVALSRSAEAYRLHLGDAVVDVDLAQSADGRAWLTLGERHLEVVVAVRGDDVFVHLDGEAYQLRYRHPLDRLAAQAGGAAEDSIVAPMPGSIVAVPVTVGDPVPRGQTPRGMESVKGEERTAAP